MLRDPLRDPRALSILSSQKIRRIQNISGLRAPKKAPESKTLWSTSMKSPDMSNKIDQYLTDIFMIVLFSPIWITLSVGVYSIISILYNWIFG